MEDYSTQIDVGYGDAWNYGVTKPAMSTSDWFSVIDKSDTKRERVSSLNAIKHSATWAAVMVIARDVSQIPFPVKRRSKDGWEASDKHPVHRLLNTRPNPWQTPSALKRWIVATTIIWGNALVEIVRDSRNQVVMLCPVYPYGLDYGVDDDGTPFYYRVDEKGNLKTWELDEVLHFSQFSDNGFWGLRLVEIIADEIGLSREVVAHLNTVFRRGTVPNFTLEFPGKLDKEARTELRKSLEAVHSGSNNAGKPLFLWEGAKASSLAVNNTDAQVLELVQEAPLLIARTLGVPPHKINDYRHSSVRANLEDSQKEYFASTLAAPIGQMREEMNYKLFPASSGFEVHPDPTELLKGDFKTQMETAGIGLSSLVITQNEARQYVGYNPVPGGNIFVNPNTMTDGSPDSDTEDTGESGGTPDDSGDTDTEEIKDAAMALLERQCESVCKSEWRRLYSYAKNPREFKRSASSLYSGLIQKYAANDLSAALDVASKLLPVRDMEAAIDKYAASSLAVALQCYDRAGGHVSTLPKMLSEGWQVSANAKRLLKILTESEDEND